MAVKLGLNCILYRNTGTYGSPVWNAIPNVRDLTLAIEKGESDVSTRGTGGYKATVATLKDASVEFEMVYDTADADFTAIKDAFFNGTSLDVAVMDGDITVTGNQGLRAVMTVMKFSRNEPLQEGVIVPISLKPTHDANPPTWYTVP